MDEKQFPEVLLQEDAARLAKKAGKVRGQGSGLSHIFSPLLVTVLALLAALIGVAPFLQLVTLLMKDPAMVSGALNTFFLGLVMLIPFAFHNA